VDGRLQDRAIGQIEVQNVGPVDGRQRGGWDVAHDGSRQGMGIVCRIIQVAQVYHKGTQAGTRQEDEQEKGRQHPGQGRPEQGGTPFESPFHADHGPAGEDPQGDARERRRIGVIAECRVLPLEEDQEEPACPEVIHEVARVRLVPPRQRSAYQRQGVEDRLGRLQVPQDLLELKSDDGPGSQQCRTEARSCAAEYVAAELDAENIGMKEDQGEPHHETEERDSREPEHVLEPYPGFARPREQSEPDLRCGDNAEGMRQQAQAGGGARDDHGALRRGAAMADGCIDGEQAQGHGHHIRTGRRRREIKGPRDEVRGRRDQGAPPIAEPETRQVIQENARDQSGEHGGHPRGPHAHAQEKVDQRLKIKGQGRQCVEDHVGLVAGRARIARGDVRDLGKARAEDRDSRDAVPVLVLARLGAVDQRDVPG
jgi:hypothetical protein